ncbi:MAG: helix-turn-helix transcriptional regulator [Carbonactinosporaceae bacterium]
MATRRLRLAQRRRAAGFSQERFAEILGVDRSTVTRWESGDTAPQPWLRPQIARSLQVSADQLDELLGAAAHRDTGSDERLDHAFEHPASVDLVAVARLRARTSDLDRRYDRAPSTSLLAEAGQYLGQIRFLRTHASSGRVRRELYTVEAEAATPRPVPGFLSPYRVTKLLRSSACPSAILLPICCAASTAWSKQACDVA